MTKTANEQKAPQKPKSAVRVTKKDQLIRLLRAKSGADVAAISERLGWQQHTTRAALSGLRKAGFGIAGEKPAKGGALRYRIASGSAVATPKPKQAATSEVDHAG